MINPVKSLVSAFFALSLFGCVTDASKQLDQQARSMQPPKNMAILYVLRPWAYRASLATARIEHNNMYVGALSTSQYLAFPVMPGISTIKEVQSGGSTTLDIQEGSINFLSMTFDMAMTPWAPPTFEQLSTEKGRERLENFSLSSSTSFSYTCGLGNLDQVKLAFQNLNEASESEREVQGVLCMVWAAANDHVDILKWGHEEANLPINYFVWGYTPTPTCPLKAAMNSRKYGAAKYLIQNGALAAFTAADFSYHAMNEEVVSNNLSNIRFLLENGVNPNLHLNYTTPLLLAVKYNKKDALKILIDAGAVVSYADPKFQDPLTLAREKQDPVLSEMLVSAGAIDYELIAKIKKQNDDLENAKQRAQFNSSVGEVVSTTAEVIGTIIGVAVGVVLIDYSAKYSAIGAGSNQETNNLTPRNPCNCKGYAGPGGPCYKGPGGLAYDGPGGPAYSGVGGPCYSGVGGSQYSGPGGPAYDGPGGPRYSGPGGPAHSGIGGPAYNGVGGPCYAGPGGPCYSGPGGTGANCPSICK